ncbi:MAG: 2-oxo acid dehydrogenase subunit E2 [Planctomycetaceae bacterium]
MPTVLDGDRIGVGQELVLSLTFDHQTIDGAPAARFLKDLVTAVENPAAKLLS